MESQIQVKVSDAELKGVYANFMRVGHSQEEFCLDFFSIFPPMGAATARVITSPGHLRRMIAALTDNLKKYEDQFGEVRPAEEPPAPTIGFGTPAS